MGVAEQTNGPDFLANEDGAFAPGAAMSQSNSEARRALKLAQSLVHVTDEQGGEIEGLKRKFSEAFSYLTLQTSETVALPARGRDGTTLGQVLLTAASSGLLVLASLCVVAGLYTGCFWELILPGSFGVLIFAMTLLAVARSAPKAGEAECGGEST
jgi:hypothetical protein